MTAFPRSLIALLRCKHDGAPLLVAECATEASDGGILEGGLTCKRCEALFSITEGILDLLGDAPLQGESLHEQTKRDERARTLEASKPAWFDDDHNQMEIVPTLAALDLKSGSAVLELGCGDGRYTTRLVRQCSAVLAVDFSRDSLRVLAERVGQVKNLGLVLADATRLPVARASFERVFSTLASNLPSDAYRVGMYRVAATALKPGGRFVYSTHHYGWRERIRRQPKVGRYRVGGILRRHFTVGECRAEALRHFASVRAWPIQIYFPFARWLGLPLVAQSRFLERVPIANRLGELILCIAERPRA